ncbi:MAG: carbohydrate kinase family protein [Balneolaceae bacterium]|nr:MAG: carbohydrate kinase family protein [Balneolaceae bacterium]
MADQKKFDILVVGELNVDIIFNQINKMPQIGEEQRAESLTVTMGSSTAIFACNIAKLGLKVSFSGKVGDDSFGKLVTDSLEANGVNTENIIRNSSLQTGATVILGINNDRMMVTYPGAMESFSLNDIDDSVFQMARHLHTSSIFFQPGIKNDLPEMMKKARMNGMTTSMDTQWDPDEKWEIDLNSIFPHLDFFMPNEKELLNLVSAASIEDAWKKLSGLETTFIIKKGTGGATWKKGNRQFHVPAYNVPNFVDAIGAGDSFNAGFIRAFLAGKTPEECMVEAAKTAAASTMAAGGTAGIASYDDVMSKTKHLKIIK